MAIGQGRYLEEWKQAKNSKQGANNKKLSMTYQIIYGPSYWVGSDQELGRITADEASIICLNIH